MWIFHVKPAKRRVFQRVYGPGGDWAQLFAKDQNYIGTELLRDSTDTRCYLTVDRWTSRAAYHHFKKKHRKEFVALDISCEALTIREIKIGEFSSMRPPANTRDEKSPVPVRIHWPRFEISLPRGDLAAKISASNPNRRESLRRQDNRCVPLPPLSTASLWKSSPLPKKVP